MKYKNIKSEESESLFFRLQLCDIVCHSRSSSHAHQWNVVMMGKDRWLGHTFIQFSFSHSFYTTVIYTDYYTAQRKRTRPLWREVVGALCRKGVEPKSQP